MDQISASLFDKTTITHPQAWRLVVLVGRDAMTVAARCTVGQDKIVCQRFAYDPALGPMLRSIEEVIYANPMLLGEFRSVVCLLDPEHWLTFPAEAGPEWCGEAAYRLLKDECSEIMLESQNGTTMALGLDIHLAGFLRRSFNSPTLTHRLTPLIRFFMKHGRLGNRSRLCLNLNERSLDVVAFGGQEASDGPVLLNTYQVETVEDAVYFAMLAIKETGTDPVNGEVTISGPRGKRLEEFTATLRKYVATVMPAIFPSEILQANQAMLQAPFELSLQILENK